MTLTSPVRFCSQQGWFEDFYFQCSNLEDTLRAQQERKTRRKGGDPILPIPWKVQDFSKRICLLIAPCISWGEGCQDNTAGAYIIGHMKFFCSSSGDSHRLCTPQANTISATSIFSGWLQEKDQIFDLLLFFLRLNRELQACCSSPPPLNHLTPLIHFISLRSLKPGSWLPLRLIFKRGSHT